MRTTLLRVTDWKYGEWLARFKTETLPEERF